MNSPQPASLASPLTVLPPDFRPEFFRIPLAGKDPFFGFSRSTYLRWGQLGKIRLLRVRSQGKIRASGILVPYSDVKRLVESEIIEPLMPTGKAVQS